MGGARRSRGRGPKRGSAVRGCSAVRGRGPGRGSAVRGVVRGGAQAGAPGLFLPGGAGTRAGRVPGRCPRAPWCSETGGCPARRSATLAPAPPTMPPPAPPTVLVPSERAVVLLSCALSALGSGLLVATHALWPDLRSRARRLLLFLSLADLLSAASYFYGVLQDFAGPSWDCVLQGALSTFANTSSFFWTVAVALYLYLSIVHGAHAPQPDRLLWAFHVVSWGVPLAITVAAVTLKKIGYDASDVSVGWCWIDLEAEDHVLWMLLTGKLWEMLAYVTLPVLYLLVRKHINRAVGARRVASGGGTSDRPGGHASAPWGPPGGQLPALLFLLGWGQSPEPARCSRPWRCTAPAWTLGELRKREAASKAEVDRDFVIRDAKDSPGPSLVIRIAPSGVGFPGIQTSTGWAGQKGEWLCSHNVGQSFRFLPLDITYVVPLAAQTHSVCKQGLPPGQESLPSATGHRHAVLLSGCWLAGRRCVAQGPAPSCPGGR
uniref:G protein-coupled receptor 157 n=1 Tax=Oryctolagus cuniculus TaxID=9986 RepID=A0A5F9CI90_RABIT